MTDFKYGDVIEYIDCTFDENMEAVKEWCRFHNVELNELIDKRKIIDNELHRFFEIGTPTNEEIAARVRNLRDDYINAVKWRIERYETQSKINVETSDSEETYMQILHYMQYLRNITNELNFPNIDVMSFEEWLNA